jgi:betaine lipid synthase
VSLYFRPKTGGKMLWLDIGGGTARNLEFLTVQTIRDNFAKIIVVDVSLSLLEVAKKRVEAAGLSDIIECVYCDFCDTKMVAEKLPKVCTSA